MQRQTIAYKLQCKHEHKNRHILGSLYTLDWTTGLLDYWTDNNYKYKWDVRGAGLDYLMSNLRTLHNRGSAADEVDAIGEQQLRWTQMGSSSWSGHKQGTVGYGHTRLVLARDTTTQGLLVSQSMGLRMLRQTHTDVVKETTPQKHTYVSSGENCCAPPCANANGGESSSDFCTVERTAGAGLHTLANEGAVAAASKATCTCNYCQSSSPVVQLPEHTPLQAGTMYW